MLDHARLFLLAEEEDLDATVPVARSVIDTERTKAATQSSLNGLVRLSETIHRLRRSEEPRHRVAAEEIRSELDLFRRGRFWFHTPWGHLREQESRAWLASDPEESRSRWEEYAHALGKVGFPVQRLAVLGRAASAALEAGDESAARRLLALGEEAVGSCDNGAALYRHHLAPLRAALGEPEGAAPAGLTRREQEVLVRLASGATNREIGEALFISPKTVSVHMSNLMGKLGVANRNAAAARARDLGLA
nr:helix-turn-helix transcriptional regulator [Nocardiopsis xinjiangensis]